MPRVTPLFQVFGGKSESLDFLHKYTPSKGVRTKVEGFCATAVWTLTDSPAPVDVINDADGDIPNLFSVIRKDADGLARAVALTPYAFDEWRAAGLDLEHSALMDPLERARCFLVRMRMSMGATAGAAFSRVVDHSRRGMASSCSRWLNVPDEILRVADRLRTVQVENLHFRDLIPKYDRPCTLWKMDPPYLPEVRRSGPVYRVEMTREEHEELLSMLVSCSGKVALCGYANELYDRELTRERGWRRHAMRVRCRSAVQASGDVAVDKNRTEVLWVKG